MKRLFTIIATHTAALLLGFFIAFFTAHFNRPRVVQEEGAVSNAFHPLGEIVDIDTVVQDESAMPYVVHVRTLDETIPLEFAFDYPDHDTLNMIQRLQDENQRLKTLQQLQSDLDKIDRENQKFRKEANTQPPPVGATSRSRPSTDRPVASAVGARSPRPIVRRLG